MNKSLVSLAIGTFTLGITEFAMMGILGDVARGIGIDIVHAGHLISAYALGVAVGAPGLIFLRKMPLRKLLLLLAAMIAIGNGLTAISPGYITLLCARFIAGLPHGAYFGAGAIVCTELAKDGKGASAVAIMVGGMTVANLIGVPGATFVSNVLSWRIAFGIVAVFGALTWVGIKSWMPILRPLPDTGLKGQFRFLRHVEPWLIYAGVFFGQASVYCWLSYVQPIMNHITGFPVADMSWIMMIIGLGMVVGNFMAGKLSDRYKPAAVSGWLCVAVVLIMPAIYLCAEIKWFSLVLAFLAAACLFGLGGPLQFLIVRYSKGGEMLGGAGIQIAFNTSNAVSAAIGALVISLGAGLAAPALAGAPLAAIGAVSLFILSHRQELNK